MRRLSSPFLVLLAAGCGGSSDGDPCAIDADKDGVMACEDCDDTDPAVFPGAPELCDGVDNDCDRNVDDDDPDLPKSETTRYWLDLDGDGYGDPNESTRRCEPSSRHVDNDLDCNDAGGAIHPGATEVCDGIDNDCDGLSDISDPDVVGAFSYYQDGDGDGHGAGAPVSMCIDLPAGFSDSGADCDDTDPNVSPDAPDDDCDGLNPNCDTVIDGWTGGCTGWDIACTDANDPSCTLVTVALQIDPSVEVDPAALAEWAKDPDALVEYGGGCMTYEITDSFTPSWTVGCVFDLSNGEPFPIQVWDVDIGRWEDMGSWSVTRSALAAAAGGGTVETGNSDVQVIFTVH